MVEILLRRSVRFEATGIRTARTRPRCAARRKRPLTTCLAVRRCGSAAGHQVQHAAEWPSGPCGRFGHHEADAVLAGFGGWLAGDFSAGENDVAALVARN